MRNHQTRWFIYFRAWRTAENSGVRSTSKELCHAEKVLTAPDIPAIQFPSSVIQLIIILLFTVEMNRSHDGLPLLYLISFKAE